MRSRGSSSLRSVWQHRLSSWSGETGSPAVGSRGWALTALEQVMHCVEMQLVCKKHPECERPVLGAWYMESHFDQFHGRSGDSAGRTRSTP